MKIDAINRFKEAFFLIALLFVLSAFSQRSFNTTKVQSHASETKVSFAFNSEAIIHQAQSVFSGKSLTLYNTSLHFTHNRSSSEYFSKRLEIKVAAFLKNKALVKQSCACRLYYLHFTPKAGEDSALS